MSFFALSLYTKGEVERWPNGLSVRWTPDRAVLEPVSRKSRLLFGPVKLFYFCSVCIQDRRFIVFETSTIKLSVNETKLTGL